MVIVCIADHTALKAVIETITATVPIQTLALLSENTLQF